MKQDITTLWKNLAAEKRNSAVDHVHYCILRAIKAKGEDKVAIAKHLLHRAFSPISNSNKLANGSHPFQVMHDNRWRIGVPNNLQHTKLLGVPIDELLTEEEIELFRTITVAVTPSSLVRYYSYFFTRQDIFEEYQLVQTAHAALELGAQLKPEQVKNLHFTCCGVPDLEALEQIEDYLTRMKIPFVTFREPDIGNQKTAIGVHPLAEHMRGALRSYPLLRFNRSQPAEIVEAALEGVM